MMIIKGYSLKNKQTKTKNPAAYVVTCDTLVKKTHINEFNMIRSYKKHP